MKSEFDELKRFAIADVLSVSGKEKTTSTIEKHIDNIIDVAIAREQNQQTKVDALTLQVAEMKSRLNDAYTDGQSAMYAARQSKVDELQKRVEDLELNIKGAVTFVDLQIEATEQGREAAIGTQAKNWWSSKLLMLRPIRRVLEQALKGGEA